MISKPFLWVLNNWRNRSNSYLRVYDESNDTLTIFIYQKHPKISFKTLQDLHVYYNDSLLNHGSSCYVVYLSIRPKIWSCNHLKCMEFNSLNLIFVYLLFIISEVQILEPVQMLVILQTWEWWHASLGSAAYFCLHMNIYFSSSSARRVMVAFEM